MIVCPSCSNESPDEAVFCGYCGNKMGAEGPKRTIFGLAAIPVHLKPENVKKQAEAASPEPPKPDARAIDALDDVDGWDIGDDDIGNPTVQTPAVKASLDDLLSAGSSGDLDGGLSLGFDADLGSATLPSTAPVEKIELEAKPKPRLSKPKLDLGDFGVRPKSETQLKKIAPPGGFQEEEPKTPVPVPTAAQTKALPALQSKMAESKPEPKVVVEALDLDDDDEDDEPVAAKSVTKSYPAPQSPSDPSYPAPVPPKGNKEDEAAFFGATLSQYGLAPVIEKPYISDEEIGSELKKANRAGTMQVVLALVVMGIIAAAIIIFVMYGESER